ncbi:putative DNA-binding transcriptional regulator YafY [Rhizobium sp. BIGb0125]|uniref:helix-turn-helix transcriptional regulator n=1 Tax=Rhizobium sp. BIGb0125 TaxID=2940618 RepID=UPI002166D4EE|nr:YafY family protein [Rhizobium sp. BIGb0125]MCS4241879.1 putative DNA-binding transcriptional regulator YafY [Rhizobium sp. BIGb0125]
MRKASRLFEIIQILRVARQPVTAQQIADTLEVTPRSVYRDIAALQAMRVPVEGERGVGYIMRPGFNLPPLMFSIEETEAIVLALALVSRTGDTELRQAAKRVSDKIASSVPEPLSRILSTTALHAWGIIANAPDGVDLSMIRRAVRNEEKLDITYQDEAGSLTERRIGPIAVIYYSETANIVAWCELRQAIRNFRADRVKSCIETQDFFKQQGEALRQLWMANWQYSQTPKTNP